jgi:hypothetical protein
MTNDIVRKLQDELTIHIRRESQVVYILVEVRKLLDSEGVGDKYVTLRFFCDWAMHTKLRKRNAGLLLQPFDEAYGRRGADGFMSTEDQRRLEKKVSLIEFSQELVEVLDGHGIKRNTLTGPAAWFRFLELYLSIIKDCSLQYTAMEIGLKHINEVTVTRYDVPAEVQEMEPEMYIPFGIDWKFAFNGKDVFHWPMPFGALKVLVREM